MSSGKYISEAKRWFSQAKEDLKAARSSLSSGHFEWSCFQSQQGGEKALKAFWLYNSYDPWGHSIIKLINDFPDKSLKKKQLDSLLKQAVDLDKLYIPTRYPNGLPELYPHEVYTEEDAEKAISSCQIILKSFEKIFEDTQ